ncbi:MAG: virginiamycin B lyase family protein, partial [Rhabdochlamydiaceae bacterium]
MVWFTDDISNAVWSFNESSHIFSKYPLPTPRSFPYQIALDQANHVWFTELDGGRIGEIVPTSGSIQEFTVPLTSAYNTAIKSTGPAGIAISKNGTIWFAESYGNSAGSFSPSDGRFHQYDLNNRGVESPTGIAIDHAGNIWITQHGASFISELDPYTNQITTISSSVIHVTISLPYFIQVDSGGNIWFNEHYGNAIARYSAHNGSLVEYDVPSRIASFGNISGVLTFALSPQGEPWFTELFTGKVGTVNISRPVDLQLRLANFSGNAISVSAGASTSLKLLIVTAFQQPQSPGNASSETNVMPVSLHSSVGEPNSNLTFQFTPQTGNGNFTSEFVIRNTGPQQESVGSDNQLYSITIS